MKAQNGIGLVELMVAVALGLTLMLGLGTVYQSVSQTNILRQGLSVLQNNERMAMMFLGNSVHSAGYYPNQATVGNTTPSNPDCIAGTTTGAICSPGTGVWADNLSIAFIATGNPSDLSLGCTGKQPLNATHTYKDVFSVAGDYLICTETDTSGVGLGSSTTVNLVSGVHGMQILYGVDPTCSGSVTNYVNAAGLVLGSCTSPLGTKLKTVNITLQMDNPLWSQTSVGQPQYVAITQTSLYMNGL